MPLIGLSQRVTLEESTQERRDALDQQWAGFLNNCGVCPFLIPNHPPTVRDILSSVPLAGIILTGGNNLQKYGGDAPERDETETLLFEWALKKDLPLLGVCRGMQFIQNYYEISLQLVPDHVTPKQTIWMDGRSMEVNSYHNYGTKDNKDPLKIWAKAEDGVVEAVLHQTANIRAIMWHPERTHPFSPFDIQLVQSLFKK